ncbi:hypothetical protein SOVF_208960 [Spinacia oleracea]|nr:hypothetical protein SOVF_208960 [Spinacia oleracea]
MHCRCLINAFDSKAPAKYSEETADTAGKLIIQGTVILQKKKTMSDRLFSSILKIYVQLVTDTGLQLIN